MRRDGGIAPCCDYAADEITNHEPRIPDSNNSEYLILCVPIVWYNSRVKLILPLLLRLKCGLIYVLAVIGLMALTMLIAVISCGRNLLVPGKVAEGKGAVMVHVGIASAELNGCLVDYDVYRLFGCYENGRTRSEEHTSELQSRI